MAKTAYMRVKGSQQFRQRLLLATLSATPLIIEDIRPDDASPGIRPHERSLLELLELICDNCVVEISVTGTKVKYKPGVIMGGRNLVHDCGLSRSIGYFLEPLIVLGLFGKKPLSITLKGITNDLKDPSVDTFQSTTLPLFERFGIPLKKRVRKDSDENPSKGLVKTHARNDRNDKPSKELVKTRVKKDSDNNSSEGLEIKIIKRGCSPGGGGLVFLKVPMIKESLSAVTWIEEGMVKRIRGITFSTCVSPEFEKTMIYAARGIFNRLLPDVHIFTDHRSGVEAGKSPGFGISLYAETTSGCFISTDAAVSYAKEEMEDLEDNKKEGLLPPEEIGEQAASMLLGEIEEGGVVDSTHQGLLFLLCALCPQDVSKVRVGKLSPYAIETLRNIRDFLGVKFDIRPDPLTETVVLKCIGCGLKNLSRKIS
ncbi:hypothetical protein Syun_023770 [Stephania yunnanensis]|uniref:RNA 3'-terminal phosphate cyclase-like protein n=1 Tax=Stephania yunnanensis TaxID=152371 RepID=A0AAP0I3W1_9MAGN